MISDGHSVVHDRPRRDTGGARRSYGRDGTSEHGDVWEVDTKVVESLRDRLRRGARRAAACRALASRRPVVPPPLAARMAEKGLIERAPGPGCTVEHRLTETGVRLHADEQGAAVVVLAEFRGLDDAERATLHALL